MASKLSIHSSPSTRRRQSGRLHTSPHGNQARNKELGFPYQVTETPPSMHKYNIMKRRRTSSLMGMDSSSSKVPRREDQDCITVDSEGYEVVEPACFPTPSTVEILNDTERIPAPNLPEDAVADGFYTLDHSEPSNSCGYDIADTSGSSGTFKTNERPAAPSTPGTYDTPCNTHRACPQCCGEALSKPDLSNEDVPDLSPNTYIYVRNLGLQSPDGSFAEHWAHYPVSFIPSTSPLGPRELDPNQYNCPYPGCIDPFGPCGRPDGYTGRDLALHIYRRHGNGPAVDRVRLDLRKRVMALHLGQGKGISGAPLPCGWKDPRRDLVRITIEMIKDLEEIRAWERSCRAVIPTNGETDSLKTATDTTQAPLPEKQGFVWVANKNEGKGKGPAVTLKARKLNSLQRADGSLSRGHSGSETELELMASPSPPARTNHFARLRDNRFQRPNGASLLHLKEVFQSPRKTYEQDVVGVLETD